MIQQKSTYSPHQLSFLWRAVWKSKALKKKKKIYTVMVQAVVMVTDWSVGDLAGSFAVWVETLLPVKQSDVEALHRVCSPLTSVFMATGAGDAQSPKSIQTEHCSVKRVSNLFSAIFTYAILSTKARMPFVQHKTCSFYEVGQVLSFSHPFCMTI